MSSKYTFKSGSNTGYFTWAASGAHYKKMVGSTLDLPKLGYSSGSTDYITAEPWSGCIATNGGFWGVQLDTPYYCTYNRDGGIHGYGSGALKIPFVDTGTAPIPSMIYSGDTYTRIFPTAASTTNNFSTNCYYHTLSGLSSGTNVTISYSGGNLQVKAGSTSWLNVAADPHILVEIQAPGGKGGKGSYYSYDGIINSNDKMAVASGGGGGSGSYLYFAADASGGTVTVTVNSTYYKVASNKATDYIKMMPGGNGGDGKTYDTPGASPGDKGVGGELYLCNSSGTIIGYSNQAIEEIIGNFCVIDTCDGSDGGAGKHKSVSGKTALNSGQHVAGTSGSAALADSIWLTTDLDAGLAICGGSPGQGEQSSGCNAFAGGGGGAASIIGSGSSHTGSGFSTAGEGAGGCGESGWTGMSSTGGSAGGNGAIRIYYKV